MRAANVSVRTLAIFANDHVRRVLLTGFLLVAASLSLSAQITVSPASLTFVKQAVGSTSAAKSVTISNSGGSSQAVNITPRGDFTETDNCGGNIGGGGSCSMNVYFAPTIAGTISGAVTIRDGANNLLAFVGLTGSGVAPVKTAPTSLNFGAIPIGTVSAAKTFKITNGTTGTISVTSILWSADYVVNTGTCLNTSLNKGQSCTVSVQVQPTSATDNGAIIITDNAPGATPLTVALLATGSGSPNAPISLSKSLLTFKGVKGGTSASQAVTVTNTSGSALTMGGITASNQYAET